MNQALMDSIAKMVAKGNRLELPEEQLANYPAVKKCLITAGGKYKRCGFDFQEDGQVIKDRLLGGEAIDDKKKYQFFQTPKELVDKMLSLAHVKADSRVLEPSAGQGAIALQIPGECVTVELMPQNVKALKRQGFDVHEGDFLEKTPEELGHFDCIVANPPFSKNQDIDHIRHMYDFLKPGGRLVSIASPSWTFGSQKKQMAFRQWINEKGARLAAVPEGTFSESGTNVRSVLVLIEEADHVW